MAIYTKAGKDSKRLKENLKCLQIKTEIFKYIVEHDIINVDEPNDKRLLNFQDDKEDSLIKYSLDLMFNEIKVYLSYNNITRAKLYELVKRPLADRDVKMSKDTFYQILRDPNNKNYSKFKRYNLAQVLIEHVPFKRWHQKYWQDYERRVKKTKKQIAAIEIMEKEFKRVIADSKRLLEEYAGTKS